MTFIVSISLSLSLKMLQCSRYQQVFKLNNEYHETVRFWCISFHILLLGWHLWIYTEQIIHSKSVLILCCCTAWWGAGVVVCLQRGAELHMAQLMPLPLAVSCFSKIHMGFIFLVLAHPGSRGQRAVKRVCVCVLFCKACRSVIGPVLTWINVKIEHRLNKMGVSGQLNFSFC